MKPKPMLMSTPMVQATIEDRKTQTRRLIEPQFDKDRNRYARMQLFHGIKQFGRYWMGTSADGSPFVNDCVFPPRYLPGDIVYVRETWQKWYPWLPNGTLSPEGVYYYAADGEPDVYMTDDNGFHKDRFIWQPSIHMPREAARLFLRITGVRAERLQEISDKDCIAEGICQLCKACEFSPNSGCVHTNFKLLWNELYAKPIPMYIKVNGKRVVDHYESYPWEDIQETRTYRGKPWIVCGNPWIWAHTFERINEEDVSDE